MLKLKDLLSEGNTYPNELYHVTSVDGFASMIKSDSIRLSFANIDGSDAEINHTKFYFFSMSYDKWGRYASSDRNLGSSVYFTNTILVMDTRAMQAKGKLVDVDYWGRNDYANDEKEVRFISDNQTLSDISKYIKEAHIYVPQTKRDVWQGKETVSSIKEKLIRTFLQVEKTDIPTFFYNDVKPFKLTLKAKSMPLKDALPRDSKIEKSQKHRKYHSYSDVDLMVIYHLLSGTVPEDDTDKGYKSVKKKYDQYIRSIQYGWGKELEQSILTDLHNAKSGGSPMFQKITDALRKIKVRNVDDLGKYLRDKYDYKN
jgi:hypothetical protein